MIKNKLLRFIKEIKGSRKYKTDEEMRKYILSICDFVGEYEFGPVFMNAQTAVDELIVFFLGKERYTNIKKSVTDIKRMNSIAVSEIKEKFYYCKHDKDDDEQDKMYMCAQRAIYKLADFFLGKNWYVVDPLTHDQINPIIVIEIEEKFYYCKKDD